MNGRNIGARIVSILLVVAMLFSLLPAGVAQAQERISQREDAEILPIASPEEIAYKIVNIISAEILIDSKGIKILKARVWGQPLTMDILDILLNKLSL